MSGLVARERPTPLAHKTRPIRNQHGRTAINAHTATNSTNALNFYSAHLRGSNVRKGLV
jgi:hypothetical protein